MSVVAAATAFLAPDAATVLGAMANNDNLTRYEPFFGHLFFFIFSLV